MYPYALQLLHEWQDPELYFQVHGAPRSVRLRSALGCSESLTIFLQQTANMPIRIRIEQQQRITCIARSASLWSAQRALPAGVPLLSRAAWLLQEQKELIFAYSEISLQHLSEAMCAAIEQGEEPLGLLFHGQAGVVERTALQIAQACIPDLARRSGAARQTAYWCRRSLFQVDRQFRARILEIFLPGCCDEPLD
jgi:chorismate-pyruvate lyase